MIDTNGITDGHGNSAGHVRGPEFPVKGPPVLLITLFDGQMCTSLRPLYSLLTSAGHLAKVLRFGVTEPYVHDLDYSVFQTLKVKFPLARSKPSQENVDLLLAYIRDLDPCWIGFNVIAPLNQLAARLSKLVRNVTSAPIIWGGYMAINEPEWCLHHANAACIGEGEHVVVELTDAIKNGKSIDGIDGLWIKARDGTLIRNGRRKLLTGDQIGELPHLFYERTEDEILIPKDALEYYANLPQSDGGKGNSATVVHDILFSRGCFFRCAYCHHEVHQVREQKSGSYYRVPSPRWVVDHCKDAKYRLNKRRFLFWDDIFPVNEEWLSEFAELYKREIDLPFSINLHPKLVRRKNIDLLVSAGMDAANIGIQSGSGRVRREVYGRKETNDEILANAEVLHPRLSICYDMIIDNPYETAEDLRESLALFLQMPHPYIADTNTLLLFRNQSLTDRALKDGHIIEDDILEMTAEREFEDFTCSPRLPRTDPENRALMMLIIATQYEFIPRDTIRSWSEDTALLQDDRLMALEILQRLYVHTRSRMYEYEWNMMDFYNQLQACQNQ